MPYASHPFPQTHPDRLAVLGWLFALEPPTLENCRELELGCAAGGNLIPMASALCRTVTDWVLAASAGKGASRNQLAEPVRQADSVGV